VAVYILFLDSFLPTALSRRTLALAIYLPSN
jgi:hypothetical protein